MGNRNVDGRCAAIEGLEAASYTGRTRRAAVLRGLRSVVRGPCSVVVFGGPGSNWTAGTETGTETEAEAEIVMAS